MPEYSDAVVQLVLFIGLVYGATIAFANWRDTIPAGAESDCDFAHHQRPRDGPLLNSLHPGDSI